MESRLLDVFVAPFFPLNKTERPPERLIIVKGSITHIVKFQLIRMLGEWILTTNGLTGQWRIQQKSFYSHLSRTY
jgi:hypothetical protein